MSKIRTTLSFLALIVFAGGCSGGATSSKPSRMVVSNLEWSKVKEGQFSGSCIVTCEGYSGNGRGLIEFSFADRKSNQPVNIQAGKGTIVQIEYQGTTPPSNVTARGIDWSPQNPFAVDIAK